MANLFDNIFKFFGSINSNSSSNMQANDNNLDDNIPSVDDGLIDVSWAGYATK